MADEQAIMMSEAPPSYDPPAYGEIDNGTIDHSRSSLPPLKVEYKALATSKVLDGNVRSSHANPSSLTPPTTSATNFTITQNALPRGGCCSARYTTPHISHTVLSAAQIPIFQVQTTRVGCGTPSYTLLSAETQEVMLNIRRNPHKCGSRHWILEDVAGNLIAQVQGRAFGRATVRMGGTQDLEIKGTWGMRNARMEMNGIEVANVERDWVKDARQRGCGSWRKEWRVHTTEGMDLGVLVGLIMVFGERGC